MHCGVWVTDDEHMRSLFSQGCFGKGYLSRSGPERIAKTKKSRAKRAAARDAKQREHAASADDRKRKRTEEDDAGNDGEGGGAWADARGDDDDVNGDDSGAASAVDGGSGRGGGGSGGHMGDDSGGRAKALKIENSDGEIVSVPVGVASDEDGVSAPGTGPLPEYLQLSFVEAFFLVYALSALTVFNEEGKEMSVADCWTAFRRSDASFAVR